MKTLEQRQWRYFGFFIVSFVLIVDFQQANFCWIYIEKSRQKQYIMRYVVVF